MSDWKEIQPVVETKHYSVCPFCSQPTGTLDHLAGQNIDTMWYCDHCGERYGLKLKDGKVFTRQVVGERHKKVLILLQAGHIALVVQGIESEAGANHRYFYEEHTCPTNYLKDVKRVIDLANMDTDPHGIFKYVGVRPYDERIEECNLSDSDLAEIVGLAQIPKLEDKK